MFEVIPKVESRICTKAKCEVKKVLGVIGRRRIPEATTLISKPSGIFDQLVE